MVAIELSKIVVVSVNIVFMIFGLACLAVGIVFKIGFDEVKEAFSGSDLDGFDLKDGGEALGIAAITFGSFILIVSILGCLGACCRLRPLLVGYGIIVILLVICEIGLVSYVGVKGSDAEDQLTKALNKTIQNYDERNDNDKSRAWTALFSVGECCGVEKWEEFDTSIVWTRDEEDRVAAGLPKDGPVPISCCRKFHYKDMVTKDSFVEVEECLKNPTEKNAYTEGCYTKIKDWISHSKGVFVGVGVAILVLELVLAAMAFFLCNRHDD